MQLTRFNAVDLFSGGGGLSEGLKQAGFDVLVAVENHLDTIDTYKRNHPDTHLFVRDIRALPASEIKRFLKGKPLHLLAGCPPCQGFSTLTRKYKRNDPRNSLVEEMGRMVEALQPSIVMMENVSGLAKKGNVYFKAFLAMLDHLGYCVNYQVLQVADYGVPQKRKRLVLLAGRGFEVKIPTNTHSQAGNGIHKKWTTVQQALDSLKNSPMSLKQSHLYGGPQAFNWHIIRDMSPINKERLRHIRPGRPRFDIPDALRPACHKGNNHGFSNVYGRMCWDKPAPTITGGCTTLSKGRFGHPDKNRTLSVREAARLQSFPDNYVFETAKIDEVCKIIGNALPVLFAKKVSLACKEALVQIKKSR